MRSARLSGPAPYGAGPFILNNLEMQGQQEILKQAKYIPSKQCHKKIVNRMTGFESATPCFRRGCSVNRIRNSHQSGVPGSNSTRTSKLVKISPAPN